MKVRDTLIVGAIAATFSAGASAMKADEGVPQGPVTASKVNESAPRNTIVALKADEGVPQNLVTCGSGAECTSHNLMAALQPDEGTPQNPIVALKADEGVPQNLVNSRTEGAA